MADNCTKKIIDKKEKNGIISSEKFIFLEVVLLSKVVGFEEKNFTFDDGKTVTGFYLYLEEKREGVTGISTDRVFVSSSKLNGYVPMLDDEIIVNYNRWGKPQSVMKS